MKRWLWIGAGVAIVGIVVLVGVMLFSKKAKRSEQTGNPDEAPLVLDDPVAAGRQLSAGKCKGDTTGKLSHLAMDESDFAFIIPYGLMVGGHVTPIDHQYYVPKDFNSPRDAYPVYAVGDAHLIEIQHRTEQPQDNAHVRELATSEYRLVFSQSCTSFYYYDLLTSLSPQLEKLVEGKQYTSVDVAVKAGDLIGHIGGQTLDFAVWDTKKPLSGFVEPQHYKGEAWKLYVADPLNYYTNDIKQIVLALSPRTESPLSGKLDWDVDGTLKGTWFLEGTDGIAGLRGDPRGEWVSHLSFAPDLYDSSRWIASMGDYPVAQDTNTQVSATQLYAKASSLAPEAITPKSGLVKIELVHGTYVDTAGQSWLQQTFTKGPKVSTNDANTQATALVQLIDQRTLKFEVFPNKTAADISGFTANAKTYTR